MRENNVSEIPMREPDSGHGTLKITLEGPPGCGKSVLTKILAGHFQDMGVRVQVTNPKDAMIPADYRFGNPKLRGDHYGAVIITTVATEE